MSERIDQAMEIASHQPDWRSGDMATRAALAIMVDLQLRLGDIDDEDVVEEMLETWGTIIRLTRARLIQELTGYADRRETNTPKEDCQNEAGQRPAKPGAADRV